MNQRGTEFADRIFIRIFMHMMVVIGALLMDGALPLAAMPQAANLKKDIEQQLQSRYIPVKLGPKGQNVITPGTILTVRVAGIRSNPSTQFTFMNNYQDGRIKHSVGSNLITDKKVVRDLQVGENVYLYKVEAKDNGVVFHIQPCGYCEISAFDPDPFRAGITFQFPKGWMGSTDLSRIDQTISEVFTVLGPANPLPQPDTGQLSTQQQPPIQPTIQETPMKIELGESIEQVLAALGQPEKLIDLGSKKIFVYKDLKITFIDGKVTDVQ